ncbi:DUF6191 domain-containing protein [Rhodococcus sp. IEGM 1379]|uniref:DUF6191 domain-containing protein n=1 Tax=Rhodococcus sp. IEGM 1379 TaxID=3047086 RepID=UPI0024B771C7|nr:DUF6191 domain-containing protein [Rhodococcus sp. IEGM 1379]MDI9916261.1 DUF6191 domain-containing protein [Rhodococcus sp. IEGM 1379]
MLVLLILFAFAETLWNRLTGGRALPWMRGRTSRSDSRKWWRRIQGSKHHEFEQRQSALMHREDDAEGEPAWVAVDTETNTVILRTR